MEREDCANLVLHEPLRQVDGPAPWHAHGSANQKHHRKARASEKRQGTKSRDGNEGWCRGRYGDFAAGSGAWALRRIIVADGAPLIG
jgi:hypothetical protein